MRRSSRNAVTRSKGRVVGYYMSWKAQKPVSWESQIERDFFMTLEADPEVIYYHEQPDPIVYQYDGCKRRYTPDAEVRYSDETLYFEVKPSSKVYALLHDEKLIQARLEIIRRGRQLVLITENEIRAKPRFDNVKLISRYKPGLDFRPDFQAIADRLGPNRNTTIEKAASLLGMEGDPYRVLQFVPMGFCRIDLKQPISLQSNICFFEGGI